MKEQLESVAEAFSHKARTYDKFGEGHENLTRMRNKVYDHIARLAPPGSHLLEINAGTGLDAVEMVKRGYRVHATDLSAGMVAEIRKKIVRNGLQQVLTAQRCSFTELEKIAGGPFDGMYSNFGGLNCIGDLTEVTRHLPQLLRPGSMVTWVVMPRICPWELLRLPKDWQTGTRRLRGSGVMANVSGVRFRAYYFTAASVRRAFGPRFRMASLEGLSVITPPADNKRFASRFPWLFRQLAALDDRISRWPPFKGWGDFFILSMAFEG